MIDDAGSDARMHCTTFFSRWIEMYIVYLCIRSIVFGSALYLCIRSIVFGSAWSICFKLLPNIQRHQHNTVLKVKSTKEENDQKPKQNTALLRNTTKQKSKTQNQVFVMKRALKSALSVGSSKFITMKDLGNK